LDILGQEAKAEAKMLIGKRKEHQIICKCLEILGDEAESYAKDKIQFWKNHDASLLIRCFQIAGHTPQAQKAANEMLLVWDRSVPVNLRVAALRAPFDSPLRMQRANEVLSTWPAQYRPLVSGALTAFHDNPERAVRYCQEILDRWHAEITYQISKKQRRYDGHIIRALSNPFVRDQTIIVAYEMLDIEGKQSGFLTEELHEKVQNILDGEWSPWCETIDGTKAPEL